MPVLRSIRERFERERPLHGVRIAVCHHVTTETAGLVRTLSAGGAEVALCASNPLSTQDDVAAALVERAGIAVHAIQGEDMATYYDHIERVVDTRPHLTMDDGADVISVLHSRRTELLSEIVGGTEETTSGVLRLRALEAEGKLGFPVIAVGAAQTKRFFDDRYGTGQSTLDGILRATNTLLAGRVVVVFGYGWTGRGIASRARGAGSQVVVCEVDPLRALEAKLDGFEVAPALAAAAKGDVFITATGNRDVVRREHFALMRDGALLCNAGHFDVELSLADLRALAPRLAPRARARRAVRHRRRPPPAPARAGPRRQPRRRRGPPGRRDGRRLRQPGARRRVPRAQRRQAAAARARGPARARPRGRAARRSPRSASRSTS